jgi:hypothetical protein
VVFLLPESFFVNRSDVCSKYTRELLWTPGSRFTDFKEHTTIFKGTIGCFNYIGTRDLCLKPGESITNTNNSTNVPRFTKNYDICDIF